MFNKYSAVLLLVTMICLAGCSSASGGIKDDSQGDNSEQVAADNDEAIDKEQADSSAAAENSEQNESSEETETLHPTEIQAIMEETVHQIHATMTKEQKSHDWFMLEEENPRKFSTELKRIKHLLSDYITDEYLDEHARKLLEAYTCYCDSHFLFTENDTQAGLTVLEQTEDSFKASSLTLDDGFNGIGWSNDWLFEKEEGNWKLARYAYAFADEKSLDITFKQIEHSFSNPETGKPEEISFVEYKKIDDTSHLVIQRENGDYEIYNTETGAMNYSAMEQCDCPS